MNATIVRLGGVFGIVAVLAMIPAYLVGTPDMAGANAAEDYFRSVDGFVLANGVSPMAHIVFYLLFLAILVAVSRKAAPDRAWPTGVLAGGVFFAALTSVGFVAEILYPATVARFPEVGIDPQFALVAATLATWLYHFCQLGAAVFALCLGIGVWTSGRYPRWLAVVSWVAAVAALLHLWLPLYSALGGLALVIVVSIMLIVRPPADGTTSRTR